MPPSSRANDGLKYQPVSSSEHQAQAHERHHSTEDPAALDLDRHLKTFKKQEIKRRAFIVMGVIAIFLFLYWAIAYVSHYLGAAIYLLSKLSFDPHFLLDQC